MFICIQGVPVFTGKWMQGSDSPFSLEMQIKSCDACISSTTELFINNVLLIIY